MFRLNAGQPRDSDTLPPLLVVLQIKITCFLFADKGSFSIARIISSVSDLGSKTMLYSALIYKQTKRFCEQESGINVWIPQAGNLLCNCEVLN